MYLPHYKKTEAVFIMVDWMVDRYFSNLDLFVIIMTLNLICCQSTIDRVYNVFSHIFIQNNKNKPKKKKKKT